MRIKSGFPESLELQLTNPHTSVDNTFPFLIDHKLLVSSRNLVERPEGISAYLSTIASRDSEMSK